MRSLSLVHIIAGLSPIYGSPPYCVPQLCNSLHELDVAARLLTVEEPDTPDAANDRAYSNDFARVPLLGDLRVSAGLAVAEALGAGVPAIATTAAPWEGLLSEGCGWWIDEGVGPLAEALRAAPALSDSERRAIGAPGRGASSPGGESPRRRSSFIDGSWARPSVRALCKRTDGVETGWPGGAQSLRAGPTAPALW